MHDTQPEDAGCMSGTRTNTLTKFITWIKGDPVKIFWLSGMAGTGKTSIAITLCRMLQDDPDIVLGGTFFCSRSAGSIARTEVRRILPTIAACLAGRFPEFASAMLSELALDNRAAHKPVSDQIGPLLVKPLVAVANNTRPIVFVIDALDECSDERELAQLLAIIADLTCDVTVKFILTSRPEMHISGTSIANPELNTIFHLHMINENEVMSDIRFYITSTLQAAAPDASWFTNDDIVALAVLSCGLFLFASTTLKYVLDPNNDEDRAERLGKAISITMQHTVVTTIMDRLYELVLTDALGADTVDDDELQKIKRILACILTSRASLSVQALAELIQIKPVRLRASLRRLHSLIHFPLSDIEPGLRTLHASFGDYFFHRSSTQLRATASLGHDTLARGCLLRMGWDDLCFNVSQSRSSYKANDTEPSCRFSLSLVYACRHWAHHVYAASDHSNFDLEIETFLWQKFLFWLEVLSIVGEIGVTSGLLRVAGSAVSPISSILNVSLNLSQVKQDLVSRFLRDANSFVASSRDAIERSAPHIYLSALPFAPKDSLIYQTFSPRCNSLVSVETFGIDRHGGDLVMTLNCDSGGVSSVTYSFDGRLIAAGLCDGSVRTWDTLTGDEMTLPLCGGQGGITSIAFAPDGKSIASGAATGVVCMRGLSFVQVTSRQLFGHTDTVDSLVFSPDSKFLASASSDKSVRLWNTVTGQGHTSFNSHVARVRTLAFSPDCHLLASGSEDQTIQLWPMAGKPTGGPLRGHNSGVCCVRFTSDGSRLASVSMYLEALLWDVRTGAIIRRLYGDPSPISTIQFSPDVQSLLYVLNLDSRNLRLWNLAQETSEAVSIAFDGHAGCIRSAVFSEDGMFVASAADDNKVRIWDATRSRTDATRSRTVGPSSLPAYSYKAVSVAISPDGAFIVTGSFDCTVRVWDPHTAEHKLPPLQGHTDVVPSVAISSCGGMIASVSADKTVRLWDATTGDAIGEPLYGHSGPVIVVTFSTDAQWLASGSMDQTVRIWSIATRQPSTIGPLVCSHPVTTVAFSVDCRLVAAAGDSDQRIYLWLAETGIPAREPLFVGDRVNMVEFSLAGTQILSLAGGKVSVWSVTTGQQILTLDNDNGYIFSAAYSPDGRIIGTGSRFDTVTLWDAQTGMILTTLCGHGPIGQGSCLRFTANGRFVVSCVPNEGIRVWDVEEALSRRANNQSDAETDLNLAMLHQGWLLGHVEELLLWIPADYLQYLRISPCTGIIGRPRVVVTTDASRLYRGENWTECWRGTSIV